MILDNSHHQKEHVNANIIRGCYNKIVKENTGRLKLTVQQVKGIIKRYID